MRELRSREARTPPEALDGTKSRRARVAMTSQVAPRGKRRLTIVARDLGTWLMLLLSSMTGTAAPKAPPASAVVRPVEGTSCATPRERAAFFCLPGLKGAVPADEVQQP